MAVFEPNHPTAPCAGRWRGAGGPRRAIEGERLRHRCPATWWPIRSPEQARDGVNEQARRGLRWVRLWSRHRITELKRRRKHGPRQTVIPQQEAEILTALFDLEEAAGKLLETGVVDPSPHQLKGG